MTPPREARARRGASRPPTRGRAGRGRRLAWTLPPLLAAAALLGPLRPGRAAEPSGTLDLTFAEAVTSLDPAAATGAMARTIVANVYDRLYAYDHLARPYRLEPSLAAAPPEVSKDGLTWTIRLREGVRYAPDPCFGASRTRALVANDVVFSLLRLLDARVGTNGRYLFGGRVTGADAFLEASARQTPDPRRTDYGPGAGYPAVPGVAAVDAHTVRLTLVRPCPELRWLLASPLASIYPPEAVRRYGERFGEHAVTTGPYVVEVFSPGRSLVLGASETYRERTYPARGRRGDAEAGYLADAGRRLPLSPRVAITFVTDPKQAWAAFLAGRCDVATVPPAEVPATIDPTTRSLRPGLAERGIGLEARPRLEIFYLAYRMSDPVLGRPAGEKGTALRRALSLADDAAWAIHDLYRGAALPVEGILLDEFPESDPTFMAPWIRQADESMDQALGAAREVLAEAGVLADGGPGPIEMDVLDHPGTREAFRRLGEAAKSIGLSLAPVYVTWPEMARRIQSGAARTWRASWEADYPDARAFLDLFYAPGHPDALAGGYQNPEYDEAFEAARSLPPGDERTKLYREMQEILAQDCPWRLEFRRLELDAVHAWVHNFRGNELCPRWFEYVRVDAAARIAARPR